MISTWPRVEGVNFRKFSKFNCNVVILFIYTLSPAVVTESLFVEVSALDLQKVANSSDDIIITVKAVTGCNNKSGSTLAAVVVVAATYKMNENISLILLPSRIFKVLCCILLVKIDVMNVMIFQRIVRAFQRICLQ